MQKLEHAINLAHNETRRYVNAVFTYILRIISIAKHHVDRICCEIGNTPQPMATPPKKNLAEPSNSSFRKEKDLNSGWTLICAASQERESYQALAHMVPFNPSFYALALVACRMEGFCFQHGGVAFHPHAAAPFQKLHQAVGGCSVGKGGNQSHCGRVSHNGSRFVELD